MSWWQHTCHQTTCTASWGHDQNNWHCLGKAIIWPTCRAARPTCEHLVMLVQWLLLKVTNARRRCYRRGCTLNCNTVSLSSRRYYVGKHRPVCRSINEREVTFQLASKWWFYIRSIKQVVSAQNGETPKVLVYLPVLAICSPKMLKLKPFCWMLYKHNLTMVSYASPGFSDLKMKESFQLCPFENYWRR